MRASKVDFMGAKLALFVGPSLVTIQRDDAPGLLWPGYWDMPGGGREGRETPLDCALRETFEELNLIVPPSHVTWARAYTNSIGRAVWFMAAWMPEHAADTIKLGDEGQRFARMTVQDYMQHDKAIGQFKSRLGDYMAGVPSLRGILQA